MKRIKRVFAVLLVVLLVASSSVEASEKSVSVTPTLSITNNTATCKVKVSNPGHMIYATLSLYRDGVPIMSWTSSATSTLVISKTYSVTSGHTYYVYAYVTTNGQTHTKKSPSITI